MVPSGRVAGWPALARGLGWACALPVAKFATIKTSPSRGATLPRVHALTATALAAALAVAALATTKLVGRQGGWRLDIDAVQSLEDGPQEAGDVARRCSR